MHNSKKILITGGTGLIGNNVIPKLLSRGYQIHNLSRTPDRFRSDESVKQFYWNPEKNEIDPSAWTGIEYVIHLSGANLAEKRWSSSYKKIIRDSRVTSTQLLSDYINNHNISLRRFLLLSAIGIYGNTDQRIVTEESPIDNTDAFIPSVCRQWESALHLNHSPVSMLRIAPVLSILGGVLKTMLDNSRRGIVGVPGNGKQWFSWIHIDDLTNNMIHILEKNDAELIYNLSSPDVVSMKNFVIMMKQYFNLSGPVLSAPAWALRLALGSFADEMMKNSRVISIRNLTFQYAFLAEAMNELSQNRANH